MFENNTLTDFTLAKRLGNGRLQKQSEKIKQNKLVADLMNSISQMLVVLNEHRQIIYANNAYSAFLGLENSGSLIGKRPGESFNCINAYMNDAGCGTTEFCKTCGAARAIQESQKGIQSTKECKILTRDNDAFELRVTATPFELDGEKLTIFTVIDISHEKRRETLERVFLHDILNSAGGISGLSAILKEIDDPEEVANIADTLNVAADSLIEEIQIQRQLGSAERGDLKPEFKEVESLMLLKEVADVYSKHELNPGKPVLVHCDSENVTCTTDPVLLKRIVGNMVKNAIEVYCPNDRITLSSARVNGSVRFAVHNNSVMEHEVQLQLFKRTFTTKGAGRGLGTYSMKLLGEKYLGGKVWFQSSKEDGTTFFIEI